jgi:hypothetical protein
MSRAHDKTKGTPKLMRPYSIAREKITPFLHDISTVAGSSSLQASCHGAFDFSKSSQFGHHPYTTEYAKSLGGRLMGIGRDPLSRVASAFANGYHDCDGVRERIGPEDPHVMKTLDATCNNTEIILAYAACVRGCMTRMLSGQLCGRGQTRFWGKRLYPVFGLGGAREAAQYIRAASTWEALRKTYAQIENTSQRQTDAVVDLIRSGSSYWGVTDDWIRSVCTFAALHPRRYGEPYDYSAFSWNARPAASPACAASVRSILQHAGWHDHSDEQVFAAIKSRSAELHARAQDHRVYHDCMQASKETRVPP